MGRRFDDRVTRKRRRRRFVWVSGAVALVTGLLYWEQTALIYVLSVLALCGFLLVVAFSDLNRGTRQADAPTQEGNVAESVGGGTTGAVTPAPEKQRAAKLRHRGAA